MMLHGYAIIVKRTGADGSKFPVTEREFKIGTSSECRILINTPYVAKEHCMLIVHDDGGVSVKNLSTNNPTIVNDIPVAGTKLLDHNDTLEIGGRLVRWQYLPDSKHYTSVPQRPISNGSPVKPRNKTTTEPKTPKTPTTTVKTPKSLKRMSFTENSLQSNANSNQGEVLRGRISANMAKIITGRKSLQATKNLFSPIEKRRRMQNLKEEHLGEMTNLRSSTEVKMFTRSSPKPRQPTPIKRLSGPTRSRRSGWNIRSPGLNTISEDPSLRAKSILLATDCVAPSYPTGSTLESSSTRGGATHVETSPNTTEEPIRDLNTPSKTPSPKKTDTTFVGDSPKNSPKIARELLNLSIDMTPSSVKTTSRTPSPWKNTSLSPLVGSAGSLNTSTGLLHFSMSSIGTPPEVLTPASGSPILSPRNTRGRNKFSPTTSLGHLATETALKTPPEVVTPQSASPIVFIDPLYFEKPRTSPLNTPVRSSPRTDRKAHLKTPSPLKSAWGTPRQTPTSITLARDVPIVYLENILSQSKRSEEATFKTPISCPSSTISSGSTPRGALFATPKHSPASDKNLKTPSSAKYDKATPLKAQKTPTPIKDVKPSKSPTPVKTANTSLEIQKSPSPAKVTKLTPSKMIKSTTPAKGAKLSHSETKKTLTPKSAKVTRSKTQESPTSSVKSLTATPSEQMSPTSARSVKATPKKMNGSLGNVRSPKALKSDVKNRKPKAGSNLKGSQAPSRNGKLTAKPDKQKTKALLVLGKASGTKAKTEIRMKQKLVKKAIKLTNNKSVMKQPPRVKTTPDQSPVSNDSLKSSPVSRASPKKSSSPVKIKTPGKDIVGSLFSHQVSPSCSSSLSADERVPLASVLMELPLINTTPLAFGRRSSKRISSKIDVARPDFTELSPTALGLTPRHVIEAIPPKQKGRRSISAPSPRRIAPMGIIKAVSSSKKHTRKSVLFSPGTKENESGNSTFNFNTPDISQDVFVSPLSPLSRTVASSNESSPGIKGSKAVNLNVSRDLISFYTPVKSPENKARSLDQQSPLLFMNELAVQAFLGTRDSAKKLSFSSGDGSRPIGTKNEAYFVKKGQRNCLSDAAVERKLYVASTRLNHECHQVPASSVSRFSEVEGVAKLLRTPKPPRSPKNDLTDVTGVKRLLAKSPKNDLRRVVGIKRMLKTPAKKQGRTKKLRQQTKNLSSAHRSPKNDLTDVEGVQQLFKSPKIPKGPKNDLTCVLGVKRIFERSPRNDLRNVFSIKNLLKTPPGRKVGGQTKSEVQRRPAKSPKNDLTDVRGVKDLLGSPRPKEKSPKNSLSDLRGVRQLLGSPRQRNSPRNDLRDVRGVRNLFASPKTVLSPRNDLRLVHGVKELFVTPGARDAAQRSPVTTRGRVRGAVTTPVTRPRRGQKPLTSEPTEGSEVTETITRRKRKASPKQETIIKQPKRSISSSSSLPKAGEKAGPTTRGRPRRAAEDSASAAGKRSSESDIEKPARAVRDRQASATKTPVSKIRKIKEVEQSTSPKKRVTRAVKTKASHTVETQMALKSPSPKVRTRRGRAQQASSPVIGASPVRTRSRPAVAKQKPAPTKKGKK